MGVNVLPQPLGQPGQHTTHSKHLRTPLSSFNSIPLILLITVLPFLLTHYILISKYALTHIIIPLYALIIDNES